MGHQQHRMSSRCAASSKTARSNSASGAAACSSSCRKPGAPPAGPWTQHQTGKFSAAFLGEQLFLAAEPFAQRQRVQLVTQQRAQANQLVAVRENGLAEDLALTGSMGTQIFGKRFVSD